MLVPRKRSARSRLLKLSVVALAVAAAVAARRDAFARRRADPPRRGDPIARTAAPGIVIAAPDAPAELALAAGDSVIDITASTFGPEAALLVRSADGRARVLRWTAGAPVASLVAELPPGFAPRGIAAHPVAPAYFVSGDVGVTSRILAVRGDGGAWTTTTVFETQREIGRLVVGSRPFHIGGDELYRLFFAARLPGGGFSLRSVTERGGVEYQVVGPKAEEVTVPDAEMPPGGVTTASGVPLSFHPRGEPMLWQDRRGCVHALTYERAWTHDEPLRALPCEGVAQIAPNGNAYLHWRPGRPGISVIGDGVAERSQAATHTFVATPVATPDGRGVIGVVTKGAGRAAVAYVPIEVPLADVANAWQHAGDRCSIERYRQDGGLFLDADERQQQLFAIYERYNYETADAGPRVPFLATTDLFWDNFGAAFNGVFILSEQQRAIGAFWTFVDSASAALAHSAPDSRWAKAFAAIAGSRVPDAAGEAGLIARATRPESSAVLDSTFDFGELLPRGHYASSPEMRLYFRAVHYLTEIGRVTDGAPLAALPASVQALAARWIDVYRPFLAAPRRPLVWGGVDVPLAPYAKHAPTGRAVFPLSWGLDNETLASTVYHDAWPKDEQIVARDGSRRLHPSGLDVAAVYGNAFARALLADTLARYPRLGPVIDGIRARRPRVAESTTVYDRWLDALGAEWADSVRFPGAPEGSRIWDAKRLQSGLASWATLREATVLANERAGAAEAGEGGFEELLFEQPRGYVEPAPQSFEAIAGLYDALARTVRAGDGWDPRLRDAVVRHLGTSAAEARRFAGMAERELRGEVLADSDFAAIQAIGGSAEHQFLIYKSLGTEDEGIPTPEPMAKIADVAGSPQPLGVLEAAVGNPMEWRQVVPFFGRRQIVVGGIYSYHELISHELYDNAKWRKEVAERAHPAWVQAYVAGEPASCRADGAR